jgi:hypothetical protein
MHNLRLVNTFVQCGRGNEGLPTQVVELSHNPVFDSLVDLLGIEIEWMIRGLKCELKAARH